MFDHEFIGGTHCFLVRPKQSAHENVIQQTQHGSSFLWYILLLVRTSQATHETVHFQLHILVWMAQVHDVWVACFHQFQHGSSIQICGNLLLVRPNQATHETVHLQLHILTWMAQASVWCVGWVAWCKCVVGFSRHVGHNPPCTWDYMCHEVHHANLHGLLLIAISQSLEMCGPIMIHVRFTMHACMGSYRNSTDHLTPYPSHEVDQCEVHHACLHGLFLNCIVTDIVLDDMTIDAHLNRQFFFKDRPTELNNTYRILYTSLFQGAKESKPQTTLWLTHAFPTTAGLCILLFASTNACQSA